MRDAVAEDFRRMPGMEVVTLDGVGEPYDEMDEWLTDEHAFRFTAATSDYAVVIAPELSELLLERATWVSEEGCKTLSVGVRGVRWTADKLWLAGHWENSDVPTPFTKQIEYWPNERMPVVIKPRTGAGSLATTLCHRNEDAEAVVESLRREHEGQLIAQDFVPGRPASVAILIGPAQIVPLLPTFQLLSSDGRFRYEGGELPIPPDLAERAITLGRRAISCVPGLLGYVGVDLILGDAADGSEDYAIEINPRLTTSYVGLRELAGFNLAEAMLRVVNGESVEPRWKPGRVWFQPDGSVSVDPTPDLATG